MKLHDVKADAPSQLNIKTSPKENIETDLPQVFPRLVDDPAGADKEYGAIIQHWHNFTSISAYLCLWLQSHFSTSAFSPTQTPVNAIREGDNSVGDNFYSKVNDLTGVIRAKGLQRTVNLDKESLSLFLRPQKVPFEFFVGSEYSNEASVIQAAFKNLFDNFLMPVIINAEEDVADTGIMSVERPYVTGQEDVSFFQKMRWSDTPVDYCYVPEDFDIVNQYTNKEVLDHLFFKIELSPLKVQAKLPEDRITVDRLVEGKVTGHFIVTPVIQLPLEMGLWVNYCTGMEQFVAADMFHFFNQMTRSNSSRWNASDRVMGMERIIGINQHNLSLMAFDPSPRTNTDGFVVGLNGEVLHIPRDVDPSIYCQALRESYDAVSGKIKETHKIPDIQSIPVNVDWYNDIFSYTSLEGNIVHKSILGAKELDAITIGKFMTNSVQEPFGSTNSYNSNFSPMAKAHKKDFLAQGDNACEHFQLYDEYEDRNDPNFMKFSRLYEVIENLHGPEPIHMVMNIADFGTAANLVGENDRKYVSAFVSYCRQISARIMDLPGVAVDTLITVKFFFHLFGNYMGKSRDYIRVYEDATKTNTVIETTDLPSKFQLPNLPGLKNLLFHQAQAVLTTSKNPLNSIITCDPGGGKTPLAIVDFVQSVIKSGGRTAVIVPEAIIREWYSALANFSKNQINCFCINKDILEKFRDQLKIDRKTLINYVKSMPPNSLVVIGMNCLSLKRDVLDNTDYETPFYNSTAYEVFPQAATIRQMEFDRLYIDESQRAKNLKATNSFNIMQVSENINKVNLLSGTIIDNVGTDLIGQFALITPAIMKDIRYFYNRYGYTDDKGKFTNYKDDSNILLKEDALPYAAWVQKDRSWWGYLLPNLATQYYEVRLTENQQKWNNFLINKAISEIENNEALKKLLAESDDNNEAQRKIELAVKGHLSAVEIFINAPDYRPEKSSVKGMNITFADNPELTKEDLISPKVGWVREICRAHFNGGELKNPDGGIVQVDGVPVVFKAQSSKILIFAYHTAVGDHMYNHLKVEGHNILRYKAGDDEVITKFKDDDRYTIMVADETSMKEGINCQCAGRIIRLESLWSQGPEIQAIARAVRPDVYDAYARESVTVDILLTHNTMELAKRARLISKVVSKERLSNFDPRFHSYLFENGIDTLELIKMNLKTVQEMNLNKDLAPYYKAERVLMQWEKMEFDRKIAIIKEYVSKKLTMPLEAIMPNLLRRESMVPVEYTGRMPNSKQIWTPIPNGGVPYDPRGLKLKPVSILVDIANEEDDGDDSTETTDIIPVDVNDMVWTEYGFGRVISIYKSSIVVNVPVLGKVTLNKQVVFVPQNMAALRRLKKEISRSPSAGITFLRNGDPLTSFTSGPMVQLPNLDKGKDKDIESPLNKTNKVKPSSEVEPMDEEELPTDRKMPVEVNSAILNGRPTVFVKRDREDKDKLKDIARIIPEANWRIMPEYTRWEIRTRKCVKPLISMIRNNFSTPSQVMKQFNSLAKQLDSKGNGIIRQRKPLEWKSNKEGDMFNFSNFFAMNHTTPNIPTGIRIYPIVDNGTLYLAAVNNIQKNQILKLKQLMREFYEKGVGRPEEVPEALLFIGTNLESAERVIRLMQKRFKLERGNHALNILRENRERLRK